MKNLQASIKARLLNLAKAEGKDFVLISRLYMQEGVLRRIGLSEYAGSFCLKGGLLLYSISGFTSRPTQDIDLLGSNIPHEEAKIRDILKEILSIQVKDGLLFSTSTMTLQDIIEGADYNGQRLKVECRLGTIRTNLKLDIGFGDVIYPGPLHMDYPTLLDARNSRMKDFYDIYDLLTKHDIQLSTLNKAIKLTIQQRKTHTPESPAIFRESFAENPRNLQLWQSFLSRIKADNIEFSLVIQTIRRQLEPIYQEMLK
jgi:hypothetical protein